MNYHLPTEFEWNELKSEACFNERGFDCAYAARVFFDPQRMSVRFSTMKTVRIKIDPTLPAALQQGHVDLARVDGTTEHQIAEHQAADEK